MSHNYSLQINAFTFIQPNFLVKKISLQTLKNVKNLSPHSPHISIPSPCNAITFFRQKPGKCNHAPKVDTTHIAPQWDNRLLAPKNPRDASGIYPKIIHSARISPIFAPNQSSSIYCIAKPLRNETAFIPQRFYCFYVR